ncbi:MAG: DoxX family membrane protein [Deltaproteobacteria bacterium]|nr:DoxX family membrane protein [Deltaproteobacteria bacterium]MBI3294520.1 DoxX family membrane protein [Deltaproteobacteria bacterium]
MQNKIQLVVRILLGALFVFGGVAFFFTTPPPLTGDMATFFNGLTASKYFFILLKGTEILCGLFLLSGFFVPLALVILAPIVLNILMVHAILEPSGLVTAVVIAVAVTFLAFFSPSYSPSIKRLFVAK